MPGVHPLLAKLRAERPATLGLVTGNYPEAIPIKFGAAGLDPGWFEITAFGDEGPTRPDLVARALAKHEGRLGRVAPERVIVIGDTPRDVACAHAHGCVALGVATGRYSTDELRAAGADVTVADLADPSPLLRLIDG